MRLPPKQALPLTLLVVKQVLQTQLLPLLMRAQLTQALAPMLVVWIWVLAVTPVVLVISAVTPVQAAMTWTATLVLNNLT